MCLWNTNAPGGNKIRNWLFVVLRLRSRSQEHWCICIFKLCIFRHKNSITLRRRIWTLLCRRTLLLTRSLRPLPQVWRTTGSMAERSPKSMLPWHPTSRTSRTTREPWYQSSIRRPGRFRRMVFKIRHFRCTVHMRSITIINQITHFLCILRSLRHIVPYQNLRIRCKYSLLAIDLALTMIMTML